MSAGRGSQAAGPGGLVAAADPLPVGHARSPRALGRADAGDTRRSSDTRGQGVLRSVHGRVLRGCAAVPPLLPAAALRRPVVESWSLVPVHAWGQQDNGGGQFGG